MSYLAKVNKRFKLYVTPFKVQLLEWKDGFWHFHTMVTWSNK